MSTYTLTLRPNGDSSVQCGIYPSSPTTHYDKVDDVTPDNNSTYITSFSNKTDIFTFENHTTESAEITKITLYTVNYGEYDDTWIIRNGQLVYDAGHGAIFPVVNGITGDSTAIVGGWGSNNFNWDYTTNPTTSLAWTWDDIDNLLAGVKLTAHNGESRCTQIYVVVTYTGNVTIYAPTAAISFSPKNPTTYYDFTINAPSVNISLVPKIAVWVDPVVGSAIIVDGHFKVIN